LRAEVGDGFVSCAFGVEVVVASGDEDHLLFGVAFVAQGDVVVQELAPGAEQHREVEFIGDYDVALEFGDGFAQEAWIG
jgi:hypothetical protein